jgi:hypothetical protein
MGVMKLPLDRPDITWKREISGRASRPSCNKRAEKHKKTPGNLFPSASILACEVTRQRLRRNSQMPLHRAICAFLEAQ